MEWALMVRCFSRKDGDGVSSRGAMFCIGPGRWGVDKLGGNGAKERSPGQEKVVLPQIRRNV